MNVVLIMAKEGSLGLPGKNIWKIKDRTLLGWTIADARKSKCVDEVFVSTNGKKVVQVAKKAGAQIIMREDELAKNEKFMDAVDQAVKFIKKKHADLEVILIPQVVVPFHDPDIFDRCISFLLEHPEYDSAVTIRRTTCIPGAIMKIQGDCLVPFFPDSQSKVSGSRQDSEGYEIDHTVECFRYRSWANRQEGIKPWNYLGKKIKGIEQNYHNPNCFVDVHTPDDIKWLEFIIGKLGFSGMKRQKSVNSRKKG